MDQEWGVRFEWPQPCTAWKRADVVTFFTNHPEFEINFDGCAVGLKTKSGVPLKNAMGTYDHLQERERKLLAPPCPPQMTQLIANALLPSKRAQQPVFGPNLLMFMLFEVFALARFHSMVSSD